MIKNKLTIKKEIIEGREYPDFRWMTLKEIIAWLIKDRPIELKRRKVYDTLVNMVENVL